jgi:photosystem II stability/assembly factor-like uncharacterized protein
VLATLTSAQLADVAFATPQVGYALDVNGGLQQTNNGGASWATLSPGTTTPAKAVVALGTRAVLLVGPVGIHRAVNGGRFEPMAAKAVASAPLSDYDLAGSTVFVFGVGTHMLLRSTSLGASWTAIHLPLTNRRGRTKETIRSVSFTSATRGLLLDGGGRVWLTGNSGATWKEVTSTGTGDGIQLAFSDATHGFLTVRSFGNDATNAYVLRTNDGGSTWHPQVITAGSIHADGILAGGALNASLLIDQRSLFTTSTGGDVAGAHASLSLSTRRRSFTRRALRAAHGTVTVNGTLTGAVGGEQIVVSRREEAGGSWQHQVVIAGANGGSFTTSWRIVGPSMFVAQWAGDSGRPGLGSKALRIAVR